MKRDKCYTVRGDGVKIPLLSANVDKRRLNDPQTFEMARKGHNKYVGGYLNGIF